MNNKNATAASALMNRSQTNKNSTNDFDAWSINNFPKIKFDSRILDLGCGLGKQLKIFSNLHKNSFFIGTDISKESLDMIEQQNDSKNIELLNIAFDEIEAAKLNWENRIDLAYSFYAFYYAKNLKHLTEEIYKSFSDEGVLWVVSPTKGTNNELFSLISEFYQIPEKVISSISEFSEDLLDTAMKVGFNSYEINLFNNQIIFNDSSTLINYYKNTTFYNEDFSKNVESKIQSFFDRNNTFLLSKNAISLKLYK